SVGAEREREREAVTVVDAQLDRRAVGRDAVDLACLAAAPDAAVLVHGDPLCVIEPERAYGSVEEHPRSGEIEDRVALHGRLSILGAHAPLSLNALASRFTIASRTAEDAAKGRMSYRVAIDIGGTFTDFVVVDDGVDGGTDSGKVLTTPADPADGVLEGLRRFVPDLSEIDFLVHGT